MMKLVKKIASKRLTKLPLFYEEVNFPPIHHFNLHARDHRVEATLGFHIMPETSRQILACYLRKIS